MVRFGKIGIVASIAFLAMQTPLALAQNDQALLDQYLLEIEQLISDNNLEGARDKLTEAQTAELRDESLDMIQGQLRLLESLNDSNSPTVSLEVETIQAVTSAVNNTGAVAINRELATTGFLTETDKTAVTDLLDSLRVAMENGELDKVRLFTDPTPEIDSLLSAVFNNYAAMRIDVSMPEADDATQSFLATLEFTELTTKNGDTAFPAQAWKTHRLRIVKSDGSWQKVLW